MNNEPSSDPLIRMSARLADANADGDIFGGWLMAVMDRAGGLMAARLAKGRTVTVAMDGMQFLAPVKVGDEVSAYGELLRVGRSSMAIKIEAWRRFRYDDHRSKVTEAVFTFVAIDENGKPRPLNLPAVNQET